MQTSWSPHCRTVVVIIIRETSSIIVILEQRENQISRAKRVVQISTAHIYNPVSLVERNAIRERLYIRCSLSIRTRLSRQPLCDPYTRTGRETARLIRRRIYISYIARRRHTRVSSRLLISISGSRARANVFSAAKAIFRRRSLAPYIYSVNRKVASSLSLSLSLFLSVQFISSPVGLSPISPYIHVALHLNFFVGSIVVIIASG